MWICLTNHTLCDYHEISSFCPAMVMPQAPFFRKKAGPICFEHIMHICEYFHDLELSPEQDLGMIKT